MAAWLTAHPPSLSAPPLPSSFAPPALSRTPPSSPPQLLVDYLSTSIMSPHPSCHPSSCLPSSPTILARGSLWALLVACPCRRVSSSLSSAVTAKGGGDGGIVRWRSGRGWMSGDGGDASRRRRLRRRRRRWRWAVGSSGVGCGSLARWRSSGLQMIVGVVEEKGDEVVGGGMGVRGGGTKVAPTTVNGSRPHVVRDPDRFITGTDLVVFDDTTVVEHEGHINDYVAGKSQNEFPSLDQRGDFGGFRGDFGIRRGKGKIIPS
ncbi:hypothetical protein CPC08DRAFT_756392 [Agrocybe pediades]|nr:hypothetical protein CPC08DRAFT_756392 [Agrocybe pediades]